MGDQDNAASAEDADNAMHIIWVKKDGSLHMTSLDNLEGPAKQRLARHGVFTRVAGTNGKNYMLMGTADPERGFAVVDYETIPMDFGICGKSRVGANLFSLTRRAIGFI